METSILAEKQSLEMPCVAPSLVGRPHRHAYFQSSRVAQASNWGAPQVEQLPVQYICGWQGIVCDAGPSHQVVHPLSLELCAHRLVCLALACNP